VGDHPGYGMRRGTILAGGHGALSPSFAETGTHDLVFLRLLARSLRALSPAHADLAAGALKRYSGDLATLGKGELWVTAGR
jgi:formylmethanofuran dehydrogenase subunit C